jgi:5-methylcytosine-specific restriction enzyme A
MNMTATRNPVWLRDELILALDLYFREPTARGSKTHPEVIKLSQTLNQLPIHSGNGHSTSFRNPNGVGMKLANFLQYDPRYAGKGLERGSKTEKQVWDEFSSDQKRLRQVAQAIVQHQGAVAPLSAVDDEDDGTAEGAVLTKVHLVRERDSTISKKKKEQVLKATGALRCEACGFDFNQRYGPLGAGFVECHHDKPVSQMQPGEKTRLADLRLVCANCHRMLHRSRPWITVEQLRQRLLPNFVI